MEDSIVERVIVLMEQYGLSASAFADKIDVQRSSMSHLVSGRNKPSLDFIQKVLNNFSDINPAWLIMGTGPMKQLDLFDIKGDVAPVEAIPAEKFQNSASIAPSVTDQTAIKQTFQEIQAPIAEPIKAVYIQTPVVEPAQVVYSQPAPAPIPEPIIYQQTATQPQPVEHIPPVTAYSAPAQSPQPAAPAFIQEVPVAALPVPPVPVTAATTAAPASDIQVQQSSQNVNQIEKSVQNDKKVVKIVFFYSDNSFEAFNPQ